MNSLERRVERLEAELGRDEKDAEIYDWEGYRVQDAKVVMWPTMETCGEAVFPDGSYKSIAPASGLTLVELIKIGTRHRDREGDPPRMTDEEHEGVRNEYKDRLFMRISGRVSVEELLFSHCHGHDPEEWRRNHQE